MMSVRPSRSLGMLLGNGLSFTSYIQIVSNQSVDDCIYALRANQGRSAWFGGYKTRMVLPKMKSKQGERRFEIEYYRLHMRTGRTANMAQRLRGMLYPEGGGTRVVAKVQFTSGAVVWFWLAAVMALVSVILLIYTRNIVMIVLIAMAATFMLGTGGMMWLDRFWLKRLLRKSIGDKADR